MSFAGRAGVTIVIATADLEKIHCLRILQRAISVRPPIRTFLTIQKTSRTIAVTSQTRMAPDLSMAASGLSSRPAIRSVNHLPSMRAGSHWRRRTAADSRSRHCATSTSGLRQTSSRRTDIMVTSRASRRSSISIIHATCCRAVHRMIRAKGPVAGRRQRPPKT